MKSKASVRQQSRPIVRILNVALASVAIMLAVSGSALAQSRLPFVGTRTFCGQTPYVDDAGRELKVETKTFVTIRKDGFTNVKTNISSEAWQTGKPRYYTVSGKLDRKSIMTNGWYFEFTSATSIKIEAENVFGEAELCTSDEATPQKSNDVQRTPAASPNALSNPPPGARAQSTSTNQIAPDALVANLYKQQQRVFQPRSRALLDKYFEKRLADSIWKALLRYESSEDKDLFGFGDFYETLYDMEGNDIDISNEVIGKPSYEGRKAQVNVSYVVTPGAATKSEGIRKRWKTTIVFLLAAGTTGWKITDIKYYGGKESMLENYSIDRFAQVDTTKSTQPANSQPADRRTGGNKAPERADPANTSASRTKSLKSQLGIEMVYIRPGSFMMGSTNGGLDEKPAHQVRINYSFYMGKYEVTQAQWQSLMGSNPSAFKDCGGNCPVERVSWDDTQEFIRRLNGMNDGYSYRLPTEAEWEYACRAEMTGEYAGDLKEMAWFSENSDRTHAVGEKQPNAWGLADMLGNVWEWCQDSRHETYDGAPSDGSAWLSVGEQKSRVMRGGSWSLYSEDLRSARRSFSFSPATFRDSSVGFRVVAVKRTTGEIVNETRIDSAALELSYWESIRNSTNPEDFKAYLEKYPNGRFASLASLRMQQLARAASNPVPADVTAAERARNTHTFEVRDASKTSGWLTVAPGSVTFEPKKAKEGKNVTLQCSEIKHFEQGQSTVATAHINLFLIGKAEPVVFYTSSGGTGVVGVFVTGLPAKPVVDITANVMSAITEACR